MLLKTDLQRKEWAEAVIKHSPPPLMYEGISIKEAKLLTNALFTAAAQKCCWSHLANHLALIHVEWAKRSGIRPEK